MAYLTMRGYFTFLIVFAACLLIISLFQFNINSKYSNVGKAVWAERYYQTEMNIKEAIIEAAREGTIEGLVSYIFCLLPSIIKSKQVSFDINCIKIYINYFAVKKIESLNGKKIDDMVITLYINAPYYPPPDIALCPPPRCSCSSSSSQNTKFNFLIDGGFNQIINILDSERDNLNNRQTEINKTAKTILSQSVLTIQKDAITVRISKPGFDDISFNMPMAEVKIK